MAFKRLVFGNVLPTIAEEDDKFCISSTGIIYNYHDGKWVDISTPAPAEEPKPKKKAPAKKKK